MALHTLTTRHGALYRHDDSDIAMEDDGEWVSIRPMDAEGLIFVDRYEWPAFVEMILAIDAKLKEANEGGHTGLAKDHPY